MPLSRRRFLSRAGLGAAALGLGVTTPVGAAPRGPRRGGDSIGDPVPGAFGDVYGRFGVPRGTALSFTGAASATRTATWLTTGEVDPGTRVQFGSVPVGARARDVGRGKFLTRDVPGQAVLAPFGFGEVDHPDFGAPLPDEHPVRVHRATMDGLRRGETTCYRVGVDGAWSPVRTFRATPDREEGFSFTHLGDHGTHVSSRRCTAAALGLDPDFHLIAGDISYANGDQRVWDRWAGEHESLSAHVPVLASPGNHESKDFLGDAYRSRFTFPNHGEPWFSLDVGNVHLVSTTAGAFLSPADPSTAKDLVARELLWLEADLAEAAVRRALGEIDFVVVTQHFPLYTEDRTRGPVSPAHVVGLEHLLQRYQVDLLLVGHDHGYQRSRPMAFGVPVGADGGDVGGYVQVVAGGGGKSLYEFTGVGTFERAFDPDAPFQRKSLWLASAAREYSFVHYAVHGETITATAYGWLDHPEQNTVPRPGQGPAVPVPPDEVDPDAAPRVIDRFTVRRKPRGLVHQVAGRSPRPAAEILAGIPEARGVVLRNAAEDCTAHAH